MEKSAIDIKLEILITRRCAMVAENEVRKSFKEAPAFGEEDFTEISQEMKGLLDLKQST